MGTRLLRTVLPLLALAAVIGLFGTAPAADKDDEGFTILFNGKNLDGWKTVLQNKDADPEKTFMVQDGIIIVTGKPNGYFYTDKSYKNYILRYDWRYKRPKGLEDDEKFAGNSGLLVHIQGEHKVWPKCIEVQGMNKRHGDIFAIGGAKGKFTPLKENVLKKARKPVGEWNTTEVICKDGEITSKVNGEEVSTGKGDLEEGPFGLQSEGAELHFRNIKIKELK